jgi:hypothetical protein
MSITLTHSIEHLIQHQGKIRQVTDLNNSTDFLDTA